VEFNSGHARGQRDPAVAVLFDQPLGQDLTQIVEEGAGCGRGGQLGAHGGRGNPD